MREELINLVKKSILFKYKLPNDEMQISKSCISNDKDICFTNSNHHAISEIIYNGIIEYAVNEFLIDYNNIDKEQQKALTLALKYDKNAKDITKLKYGIYGEVLLHAILRTHLNTEVLISKGYFYSPIEKSETKGYDTFHLIQQDDELQLWFGEVKFHTSHTSGIASILKNINKALSDSYLQDNIFAIITKKDKITTGSLLNNIIEKWENNPNISIIGEMKTNNIKLYYPMLVVYDKNNKDYDQSIKDCITYIQKQSIKNISASFDYTVFFIFLPLDEVKKIKEDVIKWITEKKQLI